MKPIFFQHIILIVSKNIWVAIAIFVFILITIFPLHRIAIDNSTTAEETLSALKDFATDVFMIDGLGNDDDQQKGIVPLVNATSSSKSRFIVSCSGHLDVYGEQSMNAPFGLRHFEYLFNHPSPQVTCYSVFANHHVDGNISDGWSPQQHYYSVVKQIDDSVSARFIFLDTPSLVNKNDSIRNVCKNNTILESNAQLAWFRDVLQNASEKWIFVIGHHSICTAGSKKDNTLELKIKPLLDHYKVDFYLSSSGFNFEHSRPEKSFVEYIASGAPVFGTQEDGTNRAAVFSSSIPGFTLISISKSLLEIFFVTADAKVIYSLKRRKESRKLPLPYSMSFN